MQLTARLIQSTQVHPGGGVAMVQLNGTYIGLQSIHRLVLLLVKHPAGRGRKSVWFSLNQITLPPT